MWFVDELEEFLHHRYGVGRGVDADDGVAAAVEEPFQHGGGDALEIVRRMVRLEACRETAPKPDRVAEGRDDAALGGDEDEILVRADLRDGRHHLGREAGGERRESLLVRLIAEKPVAKCAHAEVLDGGEGGDVMGVHDEARHLVLFIGDEGFFEELRKGHVGEKHLRRDALLVARGGTTRRDVAGPHGRSLPHQVL